MAARPVLGVMPTFVRRPQDLALTQKAILSWNGSTDQQLLVVDDGSPTEMVNHLEDMVKPFPQVDIIRKPYNSGFSATVNVGLKIARDDKMDAVLVNSDIEFIHSRWLENMQLNPAWVVGAMLLYSNKLIQHAGIYFSVINRNFDHIFKFAPAMLPAAQVRRTCPVTGALQLIKLECLETIGLYDEGFKMGWEDVSYCCDVFVHGEQCCYEPTAVAVHHESMFRGRNKTKKIADWEEASWNHLMQKHAGMSFANWCPTMIEEGAWDD